MRMRTKLRADLFPWELGCAQQLWLQPGGRTWATLPLGEPWGLGTSRLRLWECFPTSVSSCFRYKTGKNKWFFQKLRF